MQALKPFRPDIAVASELGHPETTGVGSIHVLFIIDQLCALGGAEQVLLRAVRLLPRHGVRCSIATFETNPAFKALKSLPCPLHVFPLDKTYDWHALKMGLKLRRLIRSERVDIVHTFFETSDIWGGLIAKLSRGPVLVSSRRDMGILRTRKHRIAYRLMGHLYDQVQAVSEQVRQYCIEQDGLKPERVVTLYNGTDLPAIATGAGNLRKSTEFDGTSHLVITVGNIRRVKGIDVLVRTAATVCRKFPHAAFLVVGKVVDASYLEEIQNLARTLNVARNIRFLGYQDNVAEILNQCDVFCLLSRSEGFSNALIEAMACGLPAVVTDVGGNREALCAGETGYLVSIEDAGAAAAHIINLLENLDRARQMGQAGRRRVQEHFTVEAMISNLVERYRALMRQRSS